MTCLRFQIPAAAGIACLLATPASAQLLADNNDPLTQLSRMSLEELARVEVGSPGTELEFAL